MNGVSQVLFAALVFSTPPVEQPIDSQDRLELLVDHFLIEEMKGVALTLHQPIPAEKVLAFDKDWEGRYSGYVTVLQDADICRMYYRGLPVSGQDGQNAEVTCYAESRDGVNWEKPSLGIYEIDGTRDNNVILAGMPPFSHNFCPFLDTKPGVSSEERFKAVAGTETSGLVGFVSHDGIHWKKLREEPLIKKGAFDSQNVVFWSPAEQRYCCYFRTWHDNIRRISRCVSEDFIHWSEPTLMEYSSGPVEHLYTNQTLPYFRAPHLYLSTAARFMPGRRVIDPATAEKLGLEDVYARDCSDVVLMTSRGGSLYTRTFKEAFIRPGYGIQNWASRTNYPAYGMLQTNPAELSLYIQRNYGQPSHFLQRCMIRLDGFISVRAPYEGGEFITKPLRCSGKKLIVNYSTSAAGQVQVELQDVQGNVLPGFSLEESVPLIGDDIEKPVLWKNNDIGELVGRPIRLRFVMKDADVYALRFLNK